MADICRCYWSNYIYGVAAGNLEPSLRIAPSYDESAAGRDPVIEDRSFEDGARHMTESRVANWRGPSALAELQTPCLLLDEERMTRNITRLRERLSRLGVRFRSHRKTAKSIPVARLMMEEGRGPATVSTLMEAEQFADAGVRDILYAVSIAPQKLDRVVALRRRGVDLSIILDNHEQVRAVTEKSRQVRDEIPVLVEIDAPTAIAPDCGPTIRSWLASRALIDGGSEFRGVMTHAGGSYGQAGEAAIHLAAEGETLAASKAADVLRRPGIPCPVVSVGSTPTAHFATRLPGITEVRAGVFVFFDLVMAGLGMCTLDDIALSVLATVIGYQRDRGWIMIDAGWMALSRDRGTESQEVMPLP